MNSASLWPLKNFSRIRCTTATAEQPEGTEQFSISQKTPMGGKFSSTWPVRATSGDPTVEKDRKWSYAIVRIRSSFTSLPDVRMLYLGD